MLNLHHQHHSQPITILNTVMNPMKLMKHLTKNGPVKNGDTRVTKYLDGSFHYWHLDSH